MATLAQQYNAAIQLKKDIDQHNTAIQNLSASALSSKSKTFNYDGLRYLSDYQKLSDIHAVQNKQLLAETEASLIKNKLSDYYQDIAHQNRQLLHQLNDKITDKDQIVNINTRAFDKKDLYASILASFSVVLVGILFFIILFRFGTITRNTLLTLLVVGLISYLIYVVYLLIQVHYFRSADYTLYRHTMGDNVSAETCPICDNGGDSDTLGSDGRSSKYQCP